MNRTDCGGYSIHWRKNGVTAPDNTSRPAQWGYPTEFRERAVGLVLETATEQGEGFRAVTRVAGQIGIGPESVR